MKNETMSLRERIIDTTTRMFAEHGLKSVRMDDIANEMGISKRTIYEIFKDKENLIIACLDYFNIKATIHNKEITAGARNVIEAYFMLLEDWDKQLDAGYNIMMDVRKFYPQLHEEYKNRHIREAYAKMRKVLQRGIDQGYLMKDINLDLVISVVGYSTYGIMKKEVVFPHAVSERDAFKYVTNYFLRGIATIEGIRMIDEYFEKKKSKQ